VDKKFWHNRWQSNEISFHKVEINHYLEKYYERLELGDGDEVLVPLCGKSVDMRWLARRGCRVTGVELSDIAAHGFFEEQGTKPGERIDGTFLALESDGIRLLCGDFFALEPKHTADLAAVYDRAALIALPRELRRRYVDHLRSLLAPDVPILLLTFEYPSHEIDGPPFSVSETEVRALFAGQRKVTRLESTDRLADETKLANRGLTRLVEHAFLLTGL